MNRLRLPFIAVLLSCLPVVCAAQTPEPTFELSRSYLRPTVKSLPAAEGRPLVRYLDAGRVAADEGMRLFVEGRVDALYEAMTADFKEKYSLEQFRKLSQAFEQTPGKIVSYEYRSQALSYPLLDNAPVTDLAKAKSDVYYAIKTNRLNDEGVFVRVQTMRVGDKHVVSYISTRDHHGNIPRGCSTRTHPLRKNKLLRKAS